MNKVLEIKKYQKYIKCMIVILIDLKRFLPIENIIKSLLTNRDITVYMKVKHWAL